jgi:hypothetical protein
MQLTVERVDRSDVVPAKSEPSPKGDFPLEIIALPAKTRHGPDKKAPLRKTIALTFFGLGKKAEHGFDISGTLVKTLY